MSLPNVKEDLESLLTEHNVAIESGYTRVLETLNRVGFSYSTPAMYGMACTLFSSKELIAFNLLQNAIDEAKGAARVNIIADRYAPEELKKMMKRHVGDELKHSRQFADMIPLTGYASQPVSENEGIDDVFEFDDELKTFLCRVHSIEVRSWTILRHYQNILKDLDDAELNKALPVLDEIMADEIQHVVYTGEQIQKWMKEDPLLEKTLEECFLQTNKETWNDLAEMSKYLAENAGKIFGAEAAA